MREATTEPPIVVRGVWLEIGGIKVLENVDFDLAAGETVGLIGPAGGGKTALLHVCLGRLRPAAGEARVFGASPSRLAEKRAWIGYSPQTPFRDYPPQTPVVEFVLDGVLPSEAARRRPPGLAERAVAALEKAEVAKLADQPIGGLDGVRFWRARLARALVNDPKILILDELGAGLMAHERIALFKRVAALQAASGAAVLFAARDIAPLQDVVGRIVCLNGAVRYAGAPSHVSRETLMKIYST